MTLPCRLASPSLAALLVISLACGGLRIPPPNAGAEQPSAAQREVCVTYQTDSARLNSFPRQQSMVMRSLPGFTESTLTIHYPHPSGNPDLAIATVTINPAANSSVKSGISSRIWNAIAGASEEEAGDVAESPFREVRRMDIPRWQFDGLLQKLRRERFFERVKIPAAETKLAVEIDGRRFGKDFKAVAELDSLILQIHTAGYLVQPSLHGGGQVSGSPATGLPVADERPRITRLPPVDDAR